MSMAAPPLDAVIHQHTRLQLMAALYRNGRASFTALRDGLGLTAGNLAGHAAKLEEAGYIEARRVLVDVRFEMQYRLTDRGAQAFRAYLVALRGLVEEAGVGVAPARAKARDAAGASAAASAPPP